MLERFDIVDFSIAAVGLAMLPLLPDLLANLMVAVLPNSWATDRVRSFSRSVRRVTNTVVRYTCHAFAPFFCSASVLMLPAFFLTDLWPTL